MCLVVLFICSFCLLFESLLFENVVILDEFLWPSGQIFFSFFFFFSSKNAFDNFNSNSNRSRNRNRNNKMFVSDLNHVKQTFRFSLHFFSHYLHFFSFSYIFELLLIYSVEEKFCCYQWCCVWLPLLTASNASLILLLISGSRNRKTVYLSAFFFSYDYFKCWTTIKKIAVTFLKIRQKKSKFFFFFW